MISSSGLMTGSRSTSLITDTRVHSRRETTATVRTSWYGWGVLPDTTPSGRRGRLPPAVSAGAATRLGNAAERLHRGRIRAGSARRCRPDRTPTTPWPRSTPGRNRPGRRGLRANMIASLDGGCTVDGRSAGLGNAADEHLFAVLRDLADVILVGSGTVRAERLRRHPARRRPGGAPSCAGACPATPPPIAVVTGRGLDPQLAAVHRHRHAADRDHHRTRRGDGSGRGSGDHRGPRSGESFRRRNGTGSSRLPPDPLRGRPEPARRSGGRRPARRVLPDDRADAARIAGEPGCCRARWPTPIRWELAAARLDGDHLFTRYRRTGG